MRRNDDDRRRVPGAVRVESVAGDSPVEAAIPFWITGCVRLMPPRRRNGAPITGSLANAVFPVVQALIADRLRTDPDTAAPLDRDRIARRAGLGSGKKAGWVFDYLEHIHFLRVHRHYPEPGRGREVDTFTVFTRPPLNYIGPRTHAELEHALDHPDQPLSGLLFIDDFTSGTPGQPHGSRSGTFTGTLDGLGSGSGTFTSESAGQPLGSGSGTFTSESAGQPLGSGSGTFPQRERSSISLGEREIEGSIEPVPGRPAQPPVTGPHPAARRTQDEHGTVAVLDRPAPAVLSVAEQSTAAETDTKVVFDRLTEDLTEDRAADLRAEIGAGLAAPAGLGVGIAAETIPTNEIHTDEIRTLVRRLPWAAWAQTRQPGWRLTAAAADQVHAAITEAVTTKGLTLTQATDLGLAALAEATSSQPVTYIVNAFTRHLDRRLRALDVEPLHPDPLPLPPTRPAPDRPSRPERRNRDQGKGNAAQSAQAATQAQHEARQNAVDACDHCDVHGYIPAPSTHPGYTAVTRCPHNLTGDVTGVTSDTSGVTDAPRSTTAGRAAARALFHNRPTPPAQPGPATTGQPSSPVGSSAGTTPGSAAGSTKR